MNVKKTIKTTNQKENQNDKCFEEKSELDSKERFTILLEEYRDAQSSAQHHDTLVWTVTSIFWAANILLIRVVVTTPIEKNNLKELPIILSFLGICLCLSVWEFARQFNDIMRQKYSRCKEIERRLGMTQHTNLKYTPEKQKKIYNFIMSIFIMLWVIILLYIKYRFLENIFYSLFSIPLETWR